MIPPSGKGVAPHPEASREELGRLDVAVYAAIAATPTPALDVAFRRLSRSADFSKLWLGCSAVLSALGGQRGRRPDRDTYNVPIARHVAMPRSTSWPSGHAASAFAYATGVAAALPAVGIPLNALAALVAYSRVHTGVHYPGDTIAGAVSGAALAPLVVGVLERHRRARSH